MKASSKRLLQIPSSDEIRRELAKRSYDRYVEYVHKGSWIRARHLIYVCRNVEKFINDELLTEHGEIANILILSLPPQHGKSQSITETLPSWYLGIFPDRRVIEISYADTLARRFGRRNKQKINEFGKTLFNIELSPNSRSDTEFEIFGRSGSMISRGIMAGITGNPGDLIIIDDPIKNRLEAESETYRERIWEEWLNSIKTRLSSVGKVIVIMTRWHEDDLAGRLIKQGKENTEKVYVINLPCEAEEGDPIGRKPGEPLFPEIGKDAAWLANFKKSYQAEEGSRAWNALFQGRPSAADGGIFKRSYFRYFREEQGVFILHGSQDKRIPRDLCRWFQTIDTAMKTKTTNDYTVVATWVVTPDRDLLLYDIVRDRLEVPDQWPFMQRMRQRFPMILFQAVEDKSSGTGLIQTAALAGQPVHVLKADVDKVARSFKISVLYENGKVYHKQDAAWLDDYENELLKFPNGEFDDQVDAASYAGMIGEFLAKNLPEKPEDTSMEAKVRKNISKMNKKNKQGITAL